MAVYIFIKYYHHINQFITIKWSNQVISPVQNQKSSTPEIHKAVINS